MRRLFVSALFVVALSSPAWAVSLGVTMMGPAEVPSGDPNGIGFADLVIDGLTLRWSVVVFNIDTPTAMHIHTGRRGETAPPLIPFATPFVRYEGCPSPAPPPCSERWVSTGEVELTADHAEMLSEEPSNFYLNIHNAVYPGGAVRGQLQNARYIPNAGQTPGAAETHWFTRIAALNRSFLSSSEWTIEFMPQSPAGNTDRYMAGQMALAPLNIQAASEFPVQNFTGIGALRILSDQPMEVTASIYNGTGTGRGDFGYAVGGVELEDAKSSGLFVDLATSSAEDVQAGRGHRSNIGYFNPQPTSVDVTFGAYGDRGVLLGQRTVTIPPGGMVQSAVFDLIDSVVPSERVRDSYMVSWVADAPIFVYATVVNNDTGDAEFRD